MRNIPAGMKSGSSSPVIPVAALSVHYVEPVRVPLPFLLKSGPHAVAECSGSLSRLQSEAVPIA